MTLAELRTLCDGATPGPWEPNMAYTGHGGWLACGPNAVARAQVLVDAEFIAAARAALPKLLAVAEAAQAAVANDLEWERFDYKTVEHVPEDDRVHTRRMKAALAALEAP